MPFGIGIWELLILLLVLLLVFGPKRLPEMGRQLGKGMREFKDSVTGDSKDDEDVGLPPAEAVVLPESTVPVVPAASDPVAPAASESRARDTAS
jgi:sec-independent protein translocase protein TatA